MSYKRVIPCIFVDSGMAVSWFNDGSVISNDVMSLAKYYSDHGADELLIFNLSDSAEDQDEMIEMIGSIRNVIRIPMVAGGNIKDIDDVERILKAGTKRAMINCSKKDCISLMEEAADKFGKEKVAVSLNDFDTLFKHQHRINKFTSEIIFMHRLDLNSVMNITDIPCVIVTDTMEEPELFKILKCPGVKALSGKYVSQRDMDFNEFKNKCAEEDIQMTTFDSVLDFSDFKLNSDGLLPVVVQHYKTLEVLMVAYMDEEAFNSTIKTGRMTYFSRSRQSKWIKGETSGHFQYVKSLTIDCDKDTLLAKVDQVGAACHTGNPTCFFQPIAGKDNEVTMPLHILENVHNKVMDRKENPVEDSYTSYLFEKGLDKILQKIGEEATELIIAAKNQDSEKVVYEMADFLYHSMILSVEKGINWEEVIKELAER